MMFVPHSLSFCTLSLPAMTPSFSPAPLIPYVESLGLKYHYIRDDIVARANSAGKDGKMVSSLCAFCARMKRGNLYATARKNNCNKLVLAQHLDDCAESFMMSVMHNGFLRTMKANYQIDAGDISVIRPLVYCRESLMSEFAKSANLPVINENCPACFEEPKERARVKKLLSREELNYPNFYDNIRRGLMPLMHEDSESILRCVTEEALAKSRKNNVPTNGKKSYHSQENGTSVGPDGAGEGRLCDASDAELALEVARRKARRTERKTEASLAQPVCNTPGACSLFD
jgi:PP-loop family